MGQIFSTIWTLEQSEALRAHIDFGELSYARIAEDINARFGTFYSRNAAIGKAGRMGLCNPYREKVAKLPKPRKPQPSKPRPRPAFERVENIQLRCAEIVPRNLSLLDLGPDDCRYPVNDDSPFLFCGHRKLKGASYCGPHFALTLKSGAA